MTQVTNQHTIFKFMYNVKNRPSKQYYAHSEFWLSNNDFSDRKIKQFYIYTWSYFNMKYVSFINLVQIR